MLFGDGVVFVEWVVVIDVEFGVIVKLGVIIMDLF